MFNDPFYFTVFALTLTAAGIVSSQDTVRRSYEYFVKTWIPYEINQGSQYIYNDLVNAKNEFLSWLSSHGMKFNKDALQMYLPNSAYTGYPIRDMYNWVVNVLKQAHKNDAMEKLGFTYVDNCQLTYPDNYTTAPPDQWHYTNFVTIDGFAVQYTPATVDVKYTSQNGDISVGDILSYYGVDRVIYVTTARGLASCLDGDNPLENQPIIAGYDNNGKYTVILTPAVARSILGEYTGQFLRNLGLNASDTGTNYLGKLASSMSTAAIPLSSPGTTTLLDMLNPSITYQDLSQIQCDISKDYPLIYARIADQMYIASFNVSVQGGADYSDILEQIKVNTETIKANLENTKNTMLSKFSTLESLANDIKSNVSNLSTAINDTRTAAIDAKNAATDAKNAAIETKQAVQSMQTDITDTKQAVTSLTQPVQTIQQDVTESKGFLSDIKSMLSDIKDSILHPERALEALLKALFIPSPESLDFTDVKEAYSQVFPFDLLAQLGNTFSLDLVYEGSPHYTIMVFSNPLNLDFEALSQHANPRFREIVKWFIYVYFTLSVFRMLIPQFKI